MRFYLDENLSPEIAVIARRFGVDITIWRDAKQIGTTDDEQLEFATTRVAASSRRTAGISND